MILPVELGERSYDIVVEKGALKKAGEILDLDRRVLILTDSGVPEEYSGTVARASRLPFVYTVRSGEESKSLDNFEKILAAMMEAGFTRKDCVASVGGGVAGDLGGFVAACYMRGIDFYNIPTTVLSQVDSSVGGKTAVDLNGIKNIVGAFYQPKKVLIDPDTLATLPARQISNGIAEAVKMSVTSNPELFRLFESGDAAEDMERVIRESLETKIAVVEKDEREGGLRRVLNFGHTIGHGIEAVSGELLHGECVGMGMLPMCSPELRKRVENVLVKFSLPVSCGICPDAVYSAMLHDKKSSGGRISVVTVDEPGIFEIRDAAPEELMEKIKTVVRGETA